MIWPRTAPCAFSLLAAAAAPLCAQRGATPASRQATQIVVNTADEQVGREPTRFVPMVGQWIVAADDGRKVILVDGREWKKGQAAGGLADRARAIYGAAHEEFIDNVKEFSYYPIAVARDVPDFTNGEISMRFKMVAGTLDRAAGILFDVKPNGNYLAVRFNGTEDNVVLWSFTNGTRAGVKHSPENMPLELGVWHDMRLAVHGTDLKTYIDGKLMLEFTLPQPISGKVGLWSKTDSMSEFDGFTVTPAAR